MRPTIWCPLYLTATPPIVALSLSLLLVEAIISQPHLSYCLNLALPICLSQIHYKPEPAVRARRFGLARHGRMKVTQMMKCRMEFLCFCRSKIGTELTLSTNGTKKLTLRWEKERVTTPVLCNDRVVYVVTVFLAAVAALWMATMVCWSARLKFLNGYYMQYHEILYRHLQTPENESY